PRGTALLTASGGVSGTGNLVLNNNSATANGVQVTTAVLNNVGTVTNSGSGTGNVTISSVIGTNVTKVIENSATSTLTLSGANAYAGGSTIMAGTLIGSTSNSAFGTGAITIGDAVG